MFRVFFNLMQNPQQAIVCILYVEQFFILVNAFSEKSLTLFKKFFHIALFCTTLLMMQSILMQLKYCCPLSYGWWTKQNIRALLYRELLKWQTRATLKVAIPSRHYLWPDQAYVVL